MGVLGIYKNNPTAGETDGTKVVAGNPIITPKAVVPSNGHSALTGIFRRLRDRCHIR